MDYVMRRRSTVGGALEMFSLPLPLPLLLCLWLQLRTTPDLYLNLNEYESVQSSLTSLNFPFLKCVLSLTVLVRRMRAPSM